MEYCACSDCRKRWVENCEYVQASGWSELSTRYVDDFRVADFWPKPLLRLTPRERWPRFKSPFAGIRIGTLIQMALWQAREENPHVHNNSLRLQTETHLRTLIALPEEEVECMRLLYELYKEQPG